MPTIIVNRHRRVAYTGVSAAARALGVSRSAVSNFVSGRCPGCLSPEKRACIKIEDKELVTEEK